MSVKAYLVHRDVIMIDDLAYYHDELEYLWNNWSESEIWDILWNVCIDMTTDDCIGDIELTIDAWEDLKEDYKLQNSDYSVKVHNVIEEHKDVFQKIDNEFKNGEDYITIRLL